MRPRNIIEYAASKGIEFYDKTEAVGTLLTNATDTTPLHSRGNDAFDTVTRYKRQNLVNRGSELQWYKKATGTRARRGYRALVIERKYEALGELACNRLGLMPMDEADSLAHATANAELRAQLKPIDRDTFPLTIGRRGSVVIHSVYEDGRGSASIHSRSLRIETHINVLRHGVPVVNKGGIILNVEKAEEGVYFAVWAASNKKNMTPAMRKGALCDGVLVPGYDSVQTVRRHVETIRTQVRIDTVKSALKVRRTRK